MSTEEHTDSPWCCHGDHYQPAAGLEAIAWAAVRDENERRLTAAEQLVLDVLDQVEIAFEATDRGDCPEDFRSAAPARAVVAALARLEAEARERNTTTVLFENNVAGDIGTHVQTTHIDNLTLG